MAQYEQFVDQIQESLFKMVDLVPNLVQTEKDIASRKKKMEAKRDLSNILEELANYIGYISQENYSE